MIPLVLLRGTQMEETPGEREKRLDLSTMGVRAAIAAATCPLLAVGPSWPPVVSPSADKVTWFHTAFPALLWVVGSIQCWGNSKTVNIRLYTGSWNSCRRTETNSLRKVLSNREGRTRATPGPVWRGTLDSQFLFLKDQMKHDILPRFSTMVLLTVKSLPSV